MLLVYFNQQLCLSAKMHAIVFMFMFAHDVFYLHFRVFLHQQDGVVWIVDLSLFDDVVFLDSVFLAVVLYIYPKFILVADDLCHFDYILVLFYFRHDLSDSVV